MKKIKLINIMIFTFLCVIMLGCNYDVDYQKAILTEFPEATIYHPEALSSYTYLVVTKDSSVYVVNCGYPKSAEISKKQFVFSFKK